jgi:hypothetical protein
MTPPVPSAGSTTTRGVLKPVKKATEPAPNQSDPFAGKRR